MEAPVIFFLVLGGLLILGGVIFILEKEAYVFLFFWDTRLSGRRAVWLGIASILLGALFIGIYFAYALTSNQNLSS
jgi:hypothetical protein